MARTIHDIRGVLIEEMHGLQTELDALQTKEEALQAEVEALQAERKERCTTIYALDRAMAALDEGMPIPRPELPSGEPDDAGDSEPPESGNPFAYDTVESLCYDVLARTRVEIPVVEVWRQVRQATTRVIGRDTVRQALYNHPDVFFLVKQGWFRLSGR